MRTGSVLTCKNCSVESAPRVPPEKLSMKRTQRRSKGTHVPPDVTHTIGRWSWPAEHKHVSVKQLFSCQGPMFRLKLQRHTLAVRACCNELFYASADAGTTGWVVVKELCTCPAHQHHKEGKQQSCLCAELHAQVLLRYSSYFTFLLGSTFSTIAKPHHTCQRYILTRVYP